MGAAAVAVLATGCGRSMRWPQPTLTEPPVACHNRTPGTPTVTWFGTSTLLFRDGENVLLVDGFLSRPSVANMALGRLRSDERRLQWMVETHLEGLTHIFVVHNHHDHAMDAPSLALQTGARLYGDPATLALAAEKGVPVDRLEPMRVDEPIPVGPFRVTPLTGAHAASGSPCSDARQVDLGRAVRRGLRACDYTIDGVHDLMIEHGGRRWDVVGSGGLPASGVTPPDGPIDGLFLTIAKAGAQRPDDAPADQKPPRGWRDQVDAYLDRVVVPRAPGWIVPIHWDDFTRGNGVDGVRPMPGFMDTRLVSRMDRITDRATELGTAVHHLGGGGCMALPPGHPRPEVPFAGPWSGAPPRWTFARREGSDPDQGHDGIRLSPTVQLGTHTSSAGLEVLAQHPTARDHLLLFGVGKARAVVDDLGPMGGGGTFVVGGGLAGGLGPLAEHAVPLPNPMPPRPLGLGVTTLGYLDTAGFGQWTGAVTLGGRGARRGWRVQAENDFFALQQEDRFRTASIEGSGHGWWRRSGGPVPVGMGVGIQLWTAEVPRPSLDRGEVYDFTRQPGEGYSHGIAYIAVFLDALQLRIGWDSEGIRDALQNGLHDVINDGTIPPLDTRQRARWQRHREGLYLQITVNEGLVGY